MILELYDPARYMTHYYPLDREQNRFREG